MAKAASGKTVTIEQYASPQRRPADQRSTLIDTPALRGMLAKVAHLVRVVE